MKTNGPSSSSPSSSSPYYTFHIFFFLIRERHHFSSALIRRQKVRGQLWSYLEHFSFSLSSQGGKCIRSKFRWSSQFLVATRLRSLLEPKFKVSVNGSCVRLMSVNKISRGRKSRQVLLINIEVTVSCILTVVDRFLADGRNGRTTPR